MLILTRKEGQCIMLNHTVKIYVVSIRGNQVRIGIDAPDNVAIHREEIYNKIHQKDDDYSMPGTGHGTGTGHGR